MRMYRIRNRLLQYTYQPRPVARRFFSPKTLELMEAIDKEIEEKITPLLSSLWA